MLVALLLLTAGLALLATEFAWAQRWLTRSAGTSSGPSTGSGPPKPSA
jgi:Putative transmembrane protein (PGPGW)